MGLCKTGCDLVKPCNNNLCDTQNKSFSWKGVGGIEIINSEAKTYFIKVYFYIVVLLWKVGDISVRRISNLETIQL